MELYNNDTGDNCCALGLLCAFRLPFCSITTTPVTAAVPLSCSVLPDLPSLDTACLYSPWNAPINMEEEGVAAVLETELQHCIGDRRRAALQERPDLRQPRSQRNRAQRPVRREGLPGCECCPSADSPHD